MKQSNFFIKTDGLGRGMKMKYKQERVIGLTYINTDEIFTNSQKVLNSSGR